MIMEKGFIIKLVAGDYSVICNHQIFLCKARGLFRNQNQSPMVGDEVLFTYDKTTNHGVIIKFYHVKINCFGHRLQTLILL